MEYQEKPNSTCMACGHPMYCGPFSHNLHPPGQCIGPSKIDSEMIARIEALERRVSELEWK